MNTKRRVTDEELEELEALYKKALSHLHTAESKFDDLSKEKRICGKEIDFFRKVAEQAERDYWKAMSIEDVMKAPRPRFIVRTKPLADPEETRREE